MEKTRKKKRRDKGKKNKKKDKNELDSPKGDPSLLNQTSSLQVPVPNLPVAQSPHTQLQLQLQQQQQQQQLK